MRFCNKIKIIIIIVSVIVFIISYVIHMENPNYILESDGRIIKIEYED